MAPFKLYSWIRPWQEVENLSIFGKTTPYGKILFRKFIGLWRHRLTLLCSNVVKLKFVRRQIGEIVRYLVDKKFGCLSNCRYCADRAQNLPGQPPTMYSQSQCSSFHPNLFAFGGVIAERMTTMSVTRYVFAHCRRLVGTFSVKNTRVAKCHGFSNMTMCHKY